MAYTGAIQYIEAGFDQYNWVEVQSPWSRGPSGKQHLGLSPALTMGGNDNVSLMAKLYDIVSAQEAITKLYYDQPGGSEKVALQCIVVAIKKPERSQTMEERPHYVMMVKPKASGDRVGMKVYERIGVGEVLGRSLAARGTTIRIV